jgi:hypothetical protein
MGRASERYQPRHAEASVLHGVIREHLDDFLRAAADRADGAGLPEFITREFREFLTCGVLADGRVRVELKRPWSDGTTHLLFEPVEFLEKLAALTPRPEINLVLYHGALAPHARWRAEVVAYRRTERDRARDPRAKGAGAPRPRYWTWALLMRRAFDLDVLRCPRCAGRMQLIATIEDPAVIQRILAHLGLPGAREDPRPPVPLTAAGAKQPALPGVTI